jgi:hypothetical protein
VSRTIADSRYFCNPAFAQHCRALRSFAAKFCSTVEKAFTLLSGAALHKTWATADLTRCARSPHKQMQDQTDLNQEVSTRINSSGEKRKLESMKKYILCLLGGIVAMAFIASCQQQGTTTTTAAAQPSATPTRSRHHKTTAGSVHRPAQPSPSAAESPAPTP